MKKSWIDSMLALLIMPVYLFLSFVGSEGSLLCFGDDGHVALEFVEACNGAGPGSQVAGMEGDACGPCKDVQLLSSQANTNNASNSTKTLSLLSLSRISQPLPLKENPGKCIDLSQSPHSTTLASLHSVVLLI